MASETCRGHQMTGIAKTQRDRKRICNHADPHSRAGGNRSCIGPPSETHTPSFPRRRESLLPWAFLENPQTVIPAQAGIAPASGLPRKPTDRHSRAGGNRSCFGPSSKTHRPSFPRRRESLLLWAFLGNPGTVIPAQAGIAPALGLGLAFDHSDSTHQERRQRPERFPPAWE